MTQLCVELLNSELLNQVGIKEVTLADLDFEQRNCEQPEFESKFAKHVTCEVMLRDIDSPSNLLKSFVVLVKLRG